MRSDNEHHASEEQIRIDPSPSAMSVMISILTHDRWPILRQNLDGLVDIDDSALRIQIVDNASSAPVEPQVKEAYPGVSVIRSEINRGACGRNLGMAAGDSDLIVTLDDDVTDFGADDLGRVRDRFAADDRLGALCFRVIHHKTGRVCNWCHHRKVELDSLNSFRTYEISEGAVAFRREALLAAGLYPESFFISHEGLDLAYRLMNAGFTVEYDGTISVVHHHDAAGRPNWRRYYYDTRNMIWVAVRNMPWDYAARYLMLGMLSTGLYATRDGFLMAWLKAIRDGTKDIRVRRSERVVWNAGTRELCREIDRARPGLWYMAKKRLFRRTMDLA